MTIEASSPPRGMCVDEECGVCQDYEDTCAWYQVEEQHRALARAFVSVPAGGNRTINSVIAARQLADKMGWDAYEVSFHGYTNTRSTNHIGEM